MSVDNFQRLPRSESGTPPEVDSYNRLPYGKSTTGGSSNAGVTSTGSAKGIPADVTEAMPTENHTSRRDLPQSGSSPATSGSAKFRPADVDAGYNVRP